MIIFIIPFVSKQVSKNWDLAVTLLQGTLDSLDNQSSHNFKVIVSCHEIPSVQLKKNPQALSFLRMDYSPLDEHYYGKPYRDRWFKCCTALLKIRNTDFKYCMALDADDRVHQNLVDFLQEQTSGDVWLINRGYQVDYPSSRVLACQHLSRICGSTVVLSPTAAGISQSFDDKSVYDFGQCFWCACSHETAKDFFQKKKLLVKELPFSGIQYILNHQINDSKRFRRNDLMAHTKRILKFWLIGHRMSSQEFKDFGYVSHL